jgi:WS/DGAT/MGAT family acyltransferase
MEAIMWRVGHDATLRMTVGALLVVERPPAPSALLERITRATGAAPRLRRRPDDATIARLRPAWIDDADASPERHVRTLSVAAPGSLRQVLDLIGLLESVPFDPEVSPWDLTVVDGLEGGRAAVYVRAHHALTDGAGGIRLLELLLDEADRPRRPPTPVPPDEEPEPAFDGDRRPGTFTITIDLPSAIRRFVDGVSIAYDVAPVDSAVRVAQRALDVANSVSRQLMVTGGPLATRPASPSLLSHFEVLSVDGARAAALALGGSRNDLLVAAAAAGLGRYHEELGEPSPDLRLATPTSQRRGHEAGGNWFAPARLEVPTSLGRPGPQFGVIAERLAQARREPALRIASTLAAALGRLPTRLLLPALHAQADSIDFAATALPGLRGTPHLCGATIEAVYPLGPRMGCPMNITALGHGDRLDIGIALDPAAVTDPDLLLRCLTDAFAAYVDAARGGPGTNGGDDDAGSSAPTAAVARAAAPSE